MKPNPEELISVDTLIAAIETEDELGMVLRLHLAIEQLLNVYLKQMRKGEIAEYVKEPREFGGKLSLAAAFGLPLHLVRLMHLINSMRNKLAHHQSFSINANHIAELAKAVNKLSEIDKTFAPVEKRWVEFVVKRPGKKISFGEEGSRIDFLIAVTAFYSFAALWIMAKFGHLSPTS